MECLCPVAPNIDATAAERRCKSVFVWHMSSFSHMWIFIDIIPHRFNLYCWWQHIRPLPYSFTTYQDCLYAAKYFVQFSLFIMKDWWVPDLYVCATFIKLILDNWLVLWVCTWTSLMPSQNHSVRQWMNVILTERYTAGSWLTFSLMKEMLKSI